MVTGSCTAVGCVGHDHEVIEEPVDDDTTEPESEHDSFGDEPGHGAADRERDGWAVDAALGAAALAARSATDVAGAIGSSTPARVAEGAARWLTRPLARQGEEVRERLEEEAGPAAQQVIRQVTPGVVDAVDLNDVLAAIDIDALLDRIDVNRLVDRIDVGAIVAKVDVDELVAQVDVDALVQRVDVGAIVARVDLDALMASIDVDALLERIDVDALLGRIDVGALVARIDLDALLASVDLNALLTRLDLDQVLAGVDLDALLASVDLNELLQRLDMDALVANTELGAVIAQSTSGIAGEALDAVRSQGVGMDGFIARLANRALRRDVAELPAGPPLLVDAQLALPPAEPDS